MKSSAAQNNTAKIDELKNRADNRKCFDCHEKVTPLIILYEQGTTYAVMDFGIFVCSTCSGIHRELNHKVKGIAMCNFNDKEIETLTKNGNDVSDSSIDDTTTMFALDFSFSHINLLDMNRTPIKA